MPGISNERKQKVLNVIYSVREAGEGSTVKEHNLPIWIDDKQAAQSLVREGILENDPHNDDKDCYKAGPKFEKGLKKYGVTTEIGCLSP